MKLYNKNVFLNFKKNKINSYCSNISSKGLFGINKLWKPKDWMIFSKNCLINSKKIIEKLENSLDKMTSSEVYLFYDNKIIITCRLYKI